MLTNKNIVITGGLGYIGSVLVNQISGLARFNKITVLDSRFVSERVKQLRDWGIDFVNASILDEKALAKYLPQADIVIHLAGITDVAYVQTESNEAKDNEIKEVGITGTRNVIKYATKEKVKIIFPSTHVVFEGVKKTTLDIEPKETPCPVLTYAKGKYQSEMDLIKSGKNCIILRLGSVYGMGTGDTMRINIMPNLFSKIASQNGTIKLFSGGVQLKSLVSVFDVARLIVFVAEMETGHETYHVANETMTVKQVAELCKRINPKLTLEETQDEIPNLGYTISNKSLLETGFKFMYDIQNCVREMITNWSEKELRPELEYTMQGGSEFADGRGKISNYELTEPINLIGLIDSKKGSVRANHYHPIQEQKCLLVSGQYISVIQDLSYPNAPIETKVINKGDIAIIKPNVAHTMVFTEDSVFLNLVRGEREHENYGITHTIPYKLVDEQFRKDLLTNYKLNCRSCNYDRLKRVVSLGMSPLANNLCDKHGEKAETYPLEMEYCPQCSNCQLSYTVPPQKMFDSYLYVSSTAASFRKHFEQAAEQYMKEFKLNGDSLVVDIGSNDGVFLKPLKEYGIPAIGVEPAKNLAKLANDKGLKTINGYFNEETVKEILDHNQADVVTASNVFAHSDELVNITKNVFDLLKEEGVFIIEVQYLLDTIRDLTFDNIYHEHVNYWSATSICNFFNRFYIGLNVVKIEHIDTHGGSLRVYVKRKGNPIDQSVNDFLFLESKSGITNYITYKEFGKRVEEAKRNVVANIKKLKEKYSVIAGYAAPAKATTKLNYFGIGDNLVDYIIEDNNLKHGKYVPCVNIPIYSKGYAFENLPDLIIVTAWNFFENIVAANQEMINKGVRFINIRDLEDENFKV